MRAFVLAHPIVTALALLAGACAFRLVDIFVLRLDERWGEIIVSKLAGLLLLLALLGATGAGLAAIGLHGRALDASLALGAGLTLLALSLGYAVEFTLALRNGEAPSIQILAVDPKTALAGAGAFAALLLVGNVVNSLVEEGLFRGALIPLFMRHLDPWTTLAISALLFGLWHAPWALKAIVTTGEASPPAIAGLLASNFVPQALMGVVWGYLYLRTGNLWGAVAAHTLTNSAVNFVHIQSAAGMDAALPVRMIVFVAVMLAALLVVEWTARTMGLAIVRPWNS